MGLMISVSGIRGIVGKDLTVEIVQKYATAFGNYCNSGKIVIGRDSRNSGEMLKYSVLSGILSTGCEIIDLGICPTPTIEIAVKDNKASGGIAITASHNPLEWNALKFINSDGLFLDENEGNKLISIFKNENIKSVDYSHIKKVTRKDDAVLNHINKILSLPYIDENVIKKRRFRVALDCVNGAGGVMFPTLLEKLGCEVTGIYIEPNGNFRRNPEPTGENLNQLSEFIKNSQCDIGIACDPDADRLSLIDENGIPLGEEYSLISAVDFVLSKKRGTVVVNESTTKGIDFIAAKYNCDVERTKVGEINVTKRMIELNSSIGGEGNGGIIIPEVHYCRDAFTGAVLILQMLAEKGISLSKYKEGLPEYYMIKKKFDLKIDSYEDLLSILKKNVEKVKFSQIDGVKITAPDYWVHIRKSNTEPVVRIISESESEEKSVEVVEKFTDIILNSFIYEKNKR